MQRSLSVLLCLSLALAGCKAKEIVDKAAISKDLDKRGTTDLMKEVANDSYMRRRTAVSPRRRSRCT